MKQNFLRKNNKADNISDNVSIASSLFSQSSKTTTLSQAFYKKIES